jgi:hypothetical protein
MRVAVVAEFYPRAIDPVLGVWAHRQAVAARDAGAGGPGPRSHEPGAAHRAHGRGRGIAGQHERRRRN